MEILSGKINEFPKMQGFIGGATIVAGTKKHSELTEREFPDQHPISAISGLEEALNNAGQNFTTDETLSFENNVLSVNTAHEPDPDNTLPITAAAVANTVGNIEILLKTI